MWAVTSLWPQKEVYRSEIYSARAKLTMISDQARDLVRGTQRQFSENICSEDDLRSRIFGTFVVKCLACLRLLGFSIIQKMV